jgi:hypothetical protein
MSPHRLMIALLPILLLLGGCNTYRVYMDYDPEASFEGLNRFTWAEHTAPAGVSTEGQTVAVSPILDKRIRKLVKDELEARGFEPVARDQADFLVAYQIAIVDRIRVETFSDDFSYGFGWGWPYGYYGGYGHYRVFYPSYTRTYVREYQDATLIIDVLLPNGNQLIWRSWSTGAIEPGERPVKRDERLYEVISRMFQRFPPEEIATVSAPAAEDD